MQVEGYLQGSAPQSIHSSDINSGSLAVRKEEFKRELMLWCSSHSGQNTLVKPAAAVSALGELTPGGELMKGFIAESQARKGSERLVLL